MSSETKTNNPTPVLTRRKLLYGMGLAAAAVPLGQFLAASGEGTGGSNLWHCGPDGLDSGEDASDFCTTGDTRARSARWYRGVQTADANGRVNFNTCFPGWYSSRTVHIHFTVRLDNQEYVTSQFVFDDALDDEIINSQPRYNTRGSRDTTNATDNVVSAESAPEYSFQTRRMADGAMLAWKTIVIRSSLSTASCSVPGGGGGGGGPSSRLGWRHAPLTHLRVPRGDILCSGPLAPRNSP